MQANITFTVTGWDEKTEFDFGGGRKITRVLATFQYSGALEGQGELEYLMAYGADEKGRYSYTFPIHPNSIATRRNSSALRFTSSSLERISTPHVANALSVMPKPILKARANNSSVCGNIPA